MYAKAVRSLVRGLAGFNALLLPGIAMAHIGDHTHFLGGHSAESLFVVGVSAMLVGVVVFLRCRKTG